MNYELFIKFCNFNIAEPNCSFAVFTLKTDVSFCWQFGVWFGQP